MKTACFTYSHPNISNPHLALNAYTMASLACADNSVFTQIKYLDGPFKTRKLRFSTNHPSIFSYLCQIVSLRNSIVVNETIQLIGDTITSWQQFELNAIVPIRIYKTYDVGKCEGFIEIFIDNSNTIVYDRISDKRVSLETSKSVHNHFVPIIRDAANMLKVMVILLAVVAKCNTSL